MNEINTKCGGDAQVTGSTETGHIVFKSPTNTVISTVSLRYEEPFTLETLQTLIQTHTQQQKSFMIARVKTKDVSASKSVYFYYSAHQLNKVIFRKYGTNWEYLFRLFALNPLTNTDIVGDVEYFIVEPCCSALQQPESKRDKTQDEGGDVKFANERCNNPVKVSRQSLMQECLKSQVMIAEVAGREEHIQASFGDLKTRSLNSVSSGAQLKDTNDNKTLVSMRVTSSWKNHVSKTDLAKPSSMSQVKFAAPRRVTKSQTLSPDCKHSSSMPNILRSRKFFSTSALTNITEEDYVRVILRQKSGKNGDVVYSCLQDEHTEQTVTNNDVMHATFVARYLCTDDEYLQKASIRKIFEVNALTPDDNELFDIPTEVLIAEGVISSDDDDDGREEEAVEVEVEVEVEDERDDEVEGQEGERSTSATYLVQPFSGCMATWSNHRTILGILLFLACGVALGATLRGRTLIWSCVALGVLGLTIGFVLWVGHRRQHLAPHREPSDVESGEPA